MKSVHFGNWCRNPGMNQLQQWAWCGADRKYQFKVMVWTMYSEVHQKLQQEQQVQQVLFKNHDTCV